MKKAKKLMIIAACCVLAVCSAVGATLAYLFAKTDETKNTFEPVFVSCEVLESFDGEAKTNVRVKNTGGAEAYVRATFVIMWTSDSGSVYSVSPKENTDYTIVGGSNKWSKGTDGFYYYYNPISAGEATELLLSEIVDPGTAPEGYKLTVHIAATAIQSQPARAISEVWGATVNSNGTLTPP